MNTCYLKFTLLSETTFGRGDGLAGLVDTEVQHDDLGCPFMNGRALKGILVNECADILETIPAPAQQRWHSAARRLFGQPGSSLEDHALLAISDAQLPEDLRMALRGELERLSQPEEKNLLRLRNLDTLTGLRRQTAMDISGVPKEHSLRAARVILRSTPFYASLHFRKPPHPDDLALLAACVKAFRRAGTGRNRGRGRLQADLLDASKTSILERCFETFRREVTQ